MPKQESQLEQMKPYMLVAGILLILLIIVVFWPSSEETVESSTTTPVVEEEIEDLASQAQDGSMSDDEQIDEEFNPLPEMQEVVIGEEDTAIVDGEETAPVTLIEEEIEEPLDVSDSAIRAAARTIFASPMLTQLLVTDDLLQKFVINVNDLSNGDSSPRNELVVPPEAPFAVYQQAGAFFIEPGSFRRYTPYVDVLETVDVSALVSLLEDYREEIELRFEEIARPGTSFDDALLAAIDTLLDTPVLPVPYEVYSDSVMYKFKDDRIEGLPSPQKQLLRTGPQNMRRIKAVLRRIKSELYD